MRWWLILGILAIAGCSGTRSADQAPVAASPLAAWQPIDPMFKGCEGG
jgi:hypothetical protein